MNPLRSWRIWLSFLALAVFQAVMSEAVDLNQWLAMGSTMVLGAWLGVLAGRADIEEAREFMKARFAEIRQHLEGYHEPGQ